MRPERLELEGFTAFRERVEIDFSDAELFAFVGPTGSGKSSIVDAITFALYGSVPRLKKGRVEPIVSLGAERARVRFDFAIGERSYSAVRVVQRTKTGATTIEARLEGGEADMVGAAELTEAVERLLGLSYEHFTKCVVLPQGEFASFLLDGPTERQALLRQLLDLGRYGRIRELAKQRAARSEARAEGIREQLGGLAEVDEESLTRLETAVERVARTAAAVEQSAGELASAESEIEATRADLDALGRMLATLKDAEVPEEVASISANIAAARKDRTAAAARLKEATAAVTRARAAVEAAGDPAVVARALVAIDRIAELDRRIADGLEKVAGVEAAETDAAADLEKSKLAFEDAREALRRAETRHRAHALGRELAIGDVCPVCSSEITRLPDRPPGDLDELGDGHTAAEERLAAAQRSLVEARARREQYQERLEGLRSERRELAGAIGSEGRDQLEARQRQIAVATAALESSTSEVTEASEAVERAESRIASLSDRGERYWSELEERRSELASLRPPQMKRSDLDGEWGGFVRWAATTAEQVARQRAELERSLREMQRAAERIGADIRRHVDTVDVELRPGMDPLVALAAHRATLDERLARARVDLERKTELAAQLEGYEADVVVAKSLARHLRVDGFERWLIEEVVFALVASANELLAELTSGAYSLAVERGDFWVVDHLNADERRTVRTLSGGETFVVSLALALSLAKHLASMSVSGTAPLEAVFLDEGFGTLDPETLDTVAAVIHELGADGRIVGLITHVTDLAQQIPVRFEVRKRSGSSTVTRVET